MKASTLKKLLLKKLDTHLEPDGFKRASDKFYGDKYCRNLEEVRLSLNISTVSRFGVLEADLPYAGIRFNLVEDLVARFEAPQPLLELKPGGTTERTTIGVDLNPGFPLGLSRKTWKIRDEREVAVAAKEIAVFGVEKSAPFFEKYSDPRRALALLTGHDKRSWSSSGIAKLRVPRAIAMTFLLDGPDAAKRVGASELASLGEEDRTAIRLFLDQIEGAQWLGLQPSTPTSR